MGLQWRQCGPKTPATSTHPCTGPASPDWLAVQVRAGREFLSARHLTGRGYDIFLPAYRDRHRWSDRVTTVNRALFAGYLFCRVVPAAAGMIVSAPGVIRIVGNSDGPLPIPIDEIEALRKVVESQLQVRPYPFLRAGQSVRVEAGPLRGTEGVVLRFANERRLVISIPLLQRSVAVEILPEWVSVSGLAAGHAIQ